MRVTNSSFIRSKLLLPILAIALTTTNLATAQDKPDWQKHIDWAMSDTGAPDCPELYFAPDMQACLAVGLATGNSDGNRKCVMISAIQMAQSDDIRIQGGVLERVLLTQCHNGDARQALINAGPLAIINYLRSF